MTDTEKPRWADRIATAEYLGVSHMTLYRHTRDGVFTAHRIGTGPRPAIRYDLTEVDAALKAGRTAGDVVSDVVSLIRERLTIPGAKSLVPYAHVHEVIDRVAAELGVE